jgi:hypothetical protein
MANETEQAASIAEILKQRDQTRSEIISKAAALQALADKVRDSAQGNVLDEAELKQIEKIDAAMHALSEVDNHLALTTVVALNQSAAVKRLATVLKGANADLTARLEAIQDIANTIGGVAAGLQKLDGVIQGLTKLIGLFG